MGSEAIEHYLLKFMDVFENKKNYGSSVFISNDKD